MDIHELAFELLTSVGNEDIRADYLRLRKNLKYTLNTGKSSDTPFLQKNKDILTSYLNFSSDEIDYELIYVPNDEQFSTGIIKIVKRTQ